MNRLNEIDSQQEEILIAISGIKTMLQGTINEVRNTYTLKDGTRTKGNPHYLITRKDENGKTVTRGIRKEELDGYQEQVENHSRFKEMITEYVQLSEERYSLTQFDVSEDSKKNE